MMTETKLSTFPTFRLGLANNGSTDHAHVLTRFLQAVKSRPVSISNKHGLSFCIIDAAKTSAHALTFENFSQGEDEGVCSVGADELLDAVSAVDRYPNFSFDSDLDSSRLEDGSTVLKCVSGDEGFVKFETSVPMTPTSEFPLSDLSDVSFSDVFSIGAPTVKELLHLLPALGRLSLKYGFDVVGRSRLTARVNASKLVVPTYDGFWLGSSEHMLRKPEGAVDSFELVFDMRDFRLFWDAISDEYGRVSISVSNEPSGLLRLRQTCPLFTLESFLASRYDLEGDE